MRTTQISRIAFVSWLLAAIAGPAVTAQAATDRILAAYSDSGVVRLIDESGRAATTVRSRLPIVEFAVSPDAKRITFSSAARADYGGQLYEMSVPDGEPRQLTVARGSNVFGDPEFSPDGNRIAFAIRAQAHGDLVEAAGPIAIIDLETRRIRTLKGTERVGTGGVAFTNEPHWSLDGLLILYSFETGAAVVNADGKDIKDLTPLMEPDGVSWSHAVGWLGKDCVVYTAGRDQRDALRRPAQVLHLKTGRSEPASRLLGAPEERLVGITSWMGGRWVRLTAGQAQVEGSRQPIRIPIGRPPSILVRLVPSSDESNVPASCR